MDSFIEYLNKFQELLNELAVMKLVLDDEVQALILLSPLLDSWGILIVSCSNLAPIGKLTLSMIKDSILNEEARRKEKGWSSSEADTLKKRLKQEQKLLGKKRTENLTIKRRDIEVAQNQGKAPLIIIVANLGISRRNAGSSTNDQAIGKGKERR
eukprot:TRINITY_DN17697_c0_g1_i1.p1 TRINITY_DN17697_c0_g1~~TRINITY_DN17697_c0_g1_i1.p1  ORF type:complete len:155 (-),score=30.00 TRINITY_DN17697_c0_g1_i1:480-944(-)